MLDFFEDRYNIFFRIRKKFETSIESSNAITTLRQQKTHLVEWVLFWVYWLGCGLVVHAAGGGCHHRLRLFDVGDKGFGGEEG